MSFVINNDNYEEALAKGWFAKATDVRLLDLPHVKVIPDMPKAIFVHLFNLPLVNGFVKQEADLTWITLNAEKVKELKTCKVTTRKICSEYEEYTVKFKDEADEAEFVMRQS